MREYALRWFENASDDGVCLEVLLSCSASEDVGLHKDIL